MTKKFGDKCEIVLYSNATGYVRRKVRERKNARYASKTIGEYIMV